MNWKHGYFADSGYTYGYFAEAMPLWLRWAALIQGHELPAKGFRYLDAGCGQGFNLIIAAAAHPESEFVGIDFMPEHIAHGRKLAKSAGLKNVKFIEGDFLRLAEDSSELGTFDYAIAHGISSWIAPAVREAMYRLVGQVLVPGGLFYNSYNVLPGWLSTMPFQHLVLLEQKKRSGKDALLAARASMNRIKELSPKIFELLPALATRLEKMPKENPAYLVQEYNNTFWEPLFVSDMMDLMGTVKLNYLGTATLAEAFDDLLPQTVREFIKGQSDAVMREQLRDYAVNQGFRRDLYVKGGNKPWPLCQQRLIDDCRFRINPFVGRPELGKPCVIKAGVLELKGDPAQLIELLDAVGNAEEGTNLAEVVAKLLDPVLKKDVVRYLSLLMQGGWITQVVERGEPNTNGENLNKVIVNSVRQGAPYKYIGLPNSSAAQPLSEIDLVILALDKQGMTLSQVVEELKAYLKAMGRNIVIEEKHISAADELEKLLAEQVTNNRENVRKKLIDLGAWPS